MLRFSPPENWALKKSLDVGQMVNYNNKTMCMGEPVLMNPNSYATVEAILESYKDLHGIGHSRHWVFLGCDGVPYRLANQIKLANSEKFDWLVLLPGLGHLHMNQLNFWKLLEKKF